MSARWGKTARGYVRDVDGARVHLRWHDELGIWVAWIAGDRCSGCGCDPDGAGTTRRDALKSLAAGLRASSRQSWRYLAIEVEALRGPQGDRR